MTSKQELIQNYSSVIMVLIQQCTETGITEVTKTLVDAYLDQLINVVSDSKLDKAKKLLTNCARDFEIANSIIEPLGHHGFVLTPNDIKEFLNE